MLMSTLSTKYPYPSQLLLQASLQEGPTPSEYPIPRQPAITDYDNMELVVETSVGDSNLSMVASGSGDIDVLVNLSVTIFNDSMRNGVDSNLTISVVDKGVLYRSLVPVMLFFCFVSVFINVVIVISVRWLRRRPSPTLCLSVSLALADAFESFTVGSGLIVNSLLPVGYGIYLKSFCFQTAIEVLRMSGFVVSALHLLLLAVNHYIGILRPLHYASIMTQHNTLLAIALMWAFPIGFFSIYFVSVPGQGFLSDRCRVYTFTLQRTFRVVVSTLFFVPLAVMTFIYVHIFIIVKQHQRGRIQLQGTTQQQLRRNVKATVTTLLILGTYVLGWLPAVLWYIIVCENCILTTRDVELVTLLGVGFAFNTLLILKSLVDPVVYAARMTDIRAALNRMAFRCCKCFHWKCIRPESVTPSSTYSSIRSRSDTITTSMRLHSVYGNSKRSNNSPVLVYHQRVKNGHQQCNKRHGVLDDRGGGGGGGGGGGCPAIVVVVEDTDSVKKNPTNTNGQQNGEVTSC